MVGSTSRLHYFSAVHEVGVHFFVLVVSKHHPPMQLLLNEIWFLLTLAFREGVLLLLFFQLLSLSKVRNRRGNIWMAFFFLIIAVVSLNDNVFLNFIQIHDTARINRILFIPNLLLPAFFYFSIQCYVDAKRHFTKKDFLFLLPWLLHLFLIVPFLINPEIKYTTKGWYSYAMGYKYFAESVFILLVLVILFILLNLLKKHRKNIQAEHSVMEGLDLSWVSTFIFLLPLLLIAYVLVTQFDSSLLYTMGNLILTMIFVFMGIHLVKQKEIYSPDFAQGKDLSIAVNKNVSANKEQLLTQEKMEMLAKNLEELMHRKKPYLDPSLSLYQLSVLLEIRKQELSYLLNKHYQINFYTYINKYRIEESKELLQNPQKSNLSMVGIALESGFRSKSTFYTQFKELTDLTPTEYLKLLKP